MATNTLQRPPAHRRRRRRAGLLIGMLLILVGLSLLGYAGWQVFGTNVVAHRQQQQIIEQTEKAWSSGQTTGRAGATGRTKGKAGADRPAERVQMHGADALIRIPRFGEDYLVPVQDGTNREVLAEGFGRFAGAARPGQIGNFALAAHRVTHGEPLRDLPKLRPGDEVVVETKDDVFTYQMDTDPNKLIVTFNDVWVLNPLPKNPYGGVEPYQRSNQKLITLTTCSELFHTDNRMIAFGHLVGSRPR